MFHSGTELEVERSWRWNGAVRSASAGHVTVDVADADDCGTANTGQKHVFQNFSS